jgi:transcriptional activator of cad operon
MNPHPPTVWRVGDWRVDPTSDQLSRDGGKAVRIDAQALRLLLYLADRPGEVVSIDELLDHVWSGVTVSSDSVYQAVTSLRRLLGDDAKQPAYIATVPRRGYRMVAAVTPWTEAEANTAPFRGYAPAPARRRSSVWLAAFATLAVAAAVTAAIVYRVKAANVRADRSVAVVPFLDLTEDMREEYFADGITEELIDKLTKVPGLRVAPPTSSFYFKNKKVTITDIAKALGVAYVVDGSLRKSGKKLRVSARLIRADTGFVVWSDTYDRRLDDRLEIQDDIATEVTRSLQLLQRGG